MNVERILPIAFEKIIPHPTRTDVVCFENVVLTNDFAGFSLGDKFYGLVLHLMEGKVVFLSNRGTVLAEVFIKFIQCKQKEHYCHTSPSSFKMKNFQWFKNISKPVE